jgi:hypothetical protein
MRGRALIAGGSALIGAGLFVLSPAVWLIVDQLFQQILGAPLIGIVIGGGGIIVPMVLTALGTAWIIGGAWMIANGNRRLREPVTPRVPVKQADNVSRPEHKATIEE